MADARGNLRRMPGTPPSRRLSTQRRLLHPATLLLAGTFALPSCMTTALWQAPPDKVLHASEPEETEVHGVPFVARSRPALLVRVPREIQVHPLSLHPEPAQWLRIEPADAEQGDTMQALVSMLQDPWLADEIRRLHVEWVGSLENGHARISTNLFGSDLGARLRKLPGIRTRYFLYVHQVFESECQSSWLGQLPPSELGTKLRGISFAHVEPQPYGSAVWINIAWTPVTVAGDIVLSPFQLLMWLAN
jgi:hypothetical protein